MGYEFEHHDVKFHWWDIFYLVVFFLFTILARFIAIGIFYYPLSKLGYGLNWKKYVLLSYGGIRGSHSLILALVVEEGGHADVTSVKVIFYMGGVALLSLLL